MNGSYGEASAIAALALEFHRSPTKFPELLRGNVPLHASLNKLLRLAGGTQLAELDSAPNSLATEDQLRAATLFFIEQVLMQREASHYRVLGLNPDATADQIKEHHRLLMRIFHPDRESEADKRREQFATRVNLAYNTLRDANQRSSYDATLKPQATSPRQPVRRPSPVVRRRMAEPESFWTVHVHPVLMRYLPQWVLAGTALVSLMVVGGIYLLNPPVHLQQPTLASSDGPERKITPEPAANPVVEAATAEAARLDEVVAQFESGIAETGNALSASVATPEKVEPDPVPETKMQGATSKPVALMAPAQEAPPPAPRREAVVSLKPVQKAVAVLKQAPDTMTATSKPVSPAPLVNQSEPPTTHLQPAPVQAATPVATVVSRPAVLASPSPRPQLPDPNTLLARFLEAYERGDIQACMALLDEGLHADAGGKAELRREYEALFKGTDLRHVRIVSMKWSRDGEFIRGEGHYRATYMRKGETLLMTQDGQLRVEFVRRGNSALISELFYLAGGRT